MRISNEKMYARFLASDAAWNGRFFTGVLTTGIYCLPSCRARKPRPENVRFFPTCDAARAAGLRPCLKCHPDDFERGADPVLETIESVVAEVRADPSAFPDARAIVRRSGFGATRCFELFRQHYHCTPADLLLRARVTRARGLLSGTREALQEVAARSGFDSMSAFHGHLRAMNGMTPSDYRRIGDSDAFEMALPEDYPLGHLLRSLGRDPQSLTDRLTGSVYEASCDLAGVPAVLEARFSAKRAEISVHGAGLGRSQRYAAHAYASSMLGLDQDAPGFVRLARRLGLGRLVKGRTGLRVVRIPGILDGLVWSIIGQQINLPFAFTLKRRLVEAAGRPVGRGLHALPSPSALAALEVAVLRRLQFSRQKAEYLIGAARLIASGGLDLAALPEMSATRAERTLLAVRGLGPWAVNYVMMRSLGFADCVPLGDTGVASGLVSLFRLDERPQANSVQRLMSVFSPHRSLATAHLWQINQPEP